METRIIKNKSEIRCRDVKTQKACEQGWEANIVTTIKQTTCLHKYSSLFFALCKYLCRVIWKWFV